MRTQQRDMKAVMLQFMNPEIMQAEKTVARLNGILGITDEAGEVAGIIKKIMFQKHPDNEQARQDILCELGDVLFYIHLTLYALESSIEEITELVDNKLTARYGVGFSADKSMNRTI